MNNWMTLLPVLSSPFRIRLVHRYAYIKRLRSLQPRSSIWHRNYKTLPSDMGQLTSVMDSSEATGQGQSPILAQVQKNKAEEAKKSKVPEKALGVDLTEGNTKLPGLGLPLGILGYAGKGRGFPIFVDEYELEHGWRANTLLRREVCMLQLMEDLTNKPEWWRKVQDPAIAAKWEKEAVEMDWAANFMPYSDFTPDMAKACISELRKKAAIYEKSGLIPLLDYSACVIKSDKILEQDPDLVESLKSAVARLEDVPEEEKDWHPGSGEKVLDLVHPSLWPLVYGKTRVLRDRLINLDEALDSCGTGTVIEKPEGKKITLTLPGAEKKLISDDGVYLSDQFQWLPCQVKLDSGRAKIDSYINNLHPVDHAALYPIIERFIDKALPAWDLIYRWPSELNFQRLTCKSVWPECGAGDEICDGWCKPSNRPVGDDETARVEDEEYEDGYEGSERESKDEAWYESTHKIKLDDADPTASYLKVNPLDVKSSGYFNDASQIQVIVKLANIHLTPERPSYDGGSWHIEGMLNEHICATALFYYDSDNITDCQLLFRTTADREELVTALDYEQNDNLNIRRAFAIEPGQDIIQDVGSILTRPNRSLFFPNLYQHQVSPFRLADPTKPGHRKILALFLVDPANPVISTANVPPQQRHWWQRHVDMSKTSVGQLPPEIRDIVLSDGGLPMDLKEAKTVRDELIKERSALQTQGTQRLRMDWNFCEH